MSTRNGIVLIIEETPAVVAKAERVLSGAGYRVTSLDEAPKARRRARKLMPDLVLISSSLETADAARICAELSADLKLAGAPIIVLNDRDDPMDAEAMRQLGIADFIGKPFEPEALLAVVDHAFDHLRARRAPGRPTRKVGQPSARHDTIPTPIVDTIPQATATLLELAGATRLAAALADGLRDLVGDASPRVEGRLLELLTQAPVRLAVQAAAGESAPTLAGDIGDVPIAEVVQMLSLQRQSGLLSVWSGDKRVTLAFLEGSVRQVLGYGTPEELLLGNMVVREGLVDDIQMRLLLSSRGGGYRLGTQLVALGHISKQDLQAILRRQSAELVYEMLRWRFGRFAFERSDTLPEETRELDLSLHTDELLLEGYRRVDEWGLIESTIPSFDAVLRRVPGCEPRLVNLEAAEREVLGAVGEGRTVRETVEAVGWGTFEVARVIYRLVSARVLSVSLRGNIGRVAGS